jgi:hypothetical protein
MSTNCWRASIDVLLTAPIRAALASVLAFIVLSGVPFAARSRAETPAAVMRVGVHPGYGRVVFDVPADVVPEVEAVGATVVIRFPKSGVPELANPPLTNVLAMSAEPGRAMLTLAPGVRVRETRLPGRLVLDLLDAPRLPVLRPSVPASVRPTPPPGPKRPAASNEGAPPVGVAPVPVVSPAPAPASASADPPHAEPSAARADAPVSAEAPASAEAPKLVQPDPPEPSGGTAAAITQSPLPPPPRQAQADTRADTLALAASVVPAGPRQDGPASDGAIRLPFGPDTGAAAFRAGDDGLVVFDERRPVDLSAAHDDPAFGGAAIQLLPAATLLRVPLPPGRSLGLRRLRSGWEVGIVSAPAFPLNVLSQEVAAGELRLATANAGAVVAVPDGVTGATMLVGTQRQPGEAVTVARRTPGFSLRVTFQGVVVEPATDRLAMHATGSGFVITADGDMISAPAQPEIADPAAEAAAITRRFDFPALPVLELRRRLERAVAAAAATPPQSRLHARVGVAQAMVALGLGAEAAGLLRVAVEESPQGVDDPDVIALGAMAAMLEGRLADATGIESPSLSGSGDMAFWRAIRATRLAGPSDTAPPELAGGLPLLLSYPAPLRDRLLPGVLETLALGGQADVVARVLAAPQRDPGLELPRVIALEMAARPGADLAPVVAAYDRLARSSDRRARAQAAVRSVELRLTTKQLTPAAAADALERLLFAWRDDATEPRLHERIAVLRAETGDYRPAVAQLREIERNWPERHDGVRAKLSAIFAQAMQHDARTPLPPLDFIAFVEENPDLVPDGESGRAIAAEVADRLVALDLPKQALPALARLAAGTQPGVSRAEIGARSAELHLQEGDAAAALRDLETSDAPGLPAELAERRTLAGAHADAARGDLAKAIARLANLATPACSEYRAKLLEGSQDWPAAVAALKPAIGPLLQGSGAFDDAQAKLVLRFASDAAEASDDATLAELSAHDVPRMPPGPLQEMLTMLTGAPIRHAADLPVLAREAALVRTIPAALEALGRTAAAANDRPRAARGN